MKLCDKVGVSGSHAERPPKRPFHRLAVAAALTAGLALGVPIIFSKPAAADTVTVRNVNLERIELSDNIRNLRERSSKLPKKYGRNDYHQFYFVLTNAKLSASVIMDGEFKWGLMHMAYPEEKTGHVAGDGSLGGKVTEIPKEKFNQLLSLVAQVSGRRVEGFDLFIEYSQQGDEFIRTVYAIPKTGSKDPNDPSWDIIGQYQGGQLAAWISVVYGADGKLIGPYGGLALLYNPPPKEQKDNTVSQK